MKIATGLARRKKVKKETKIMGPIANYGFSKIKDLTLFFRAIGRGL
jgi:hypothetical protein